MIVYHTSSLHLPHPDIAYSREGLDFGKGFYVTKLREQAESYSRRFSLRGKQAFLNIYELSADFVDVKYKKFEVYDNEWLDFIIANRAGEESDEYDIIEGGVANDKIFRTLDLFFSGDISKEEALGRLRYERPNNQICIMRQVLVDELLLFIKSERI